MILLMFTSCINAFDLEQQDIKPVDVTVVYNDHNSTKI